jgi:NADH:ubiquinone oxidoreductase subunit B-like Fe-S oxidoreductase
LLRQAPGGSTLISALDFVVNWARANSLWPLTYGTSCCAIEMMAMGSCTITGGPFVYDNYSVIKGADRVIPVDVFVPGCPPRARLNRAWRWVSRALRPCVAGAKLPR